jgi:hypothetical protein
LDEAKSSSYTIYFITNLIFLIVVSGRTFWQLGYMKKAASTEEERRKIQFKRKNAEAAG